MSVDATGILMQGPEGAKAEGRRVYVGMLYNPQPRALDEEALSKPCDGVRYLAGLYTLPALGLQLRRQAGQVGWDDAAVWLALSDGGNGLEEFFDVNFPLAIKILDFRHTTEHLATFTKVYCPGVTGEKLLAAWCHTLKHAGGAPLVKVLKRVGRTKLPPEVRAELDGLLHYLEKNVGRMKYPEYLARGWQIATGAVESACKTVVNQRLSMGGMRWGEEGSDAVAHLRALYRSDPEQWEAFWATAA